MASPDPYYTLGRIQAVIQMLDQAQLYRMTPERALELIREIIADFKLNREVDLG